MQIEIQIDESYSEPKVVIYAPEMSEEVQMVLAKLSRQKPQLITGIKAGKVEVISQKDIIRVYTQQGKLFALTSQGKYTLRYRLYEIEQLLHPKAFVKISSSEIINLHQVKNFDFNIRGTIQVNFLDGSQTFVSRRNINKIKNILGI